MKDFQETIADNLPKVVSDVKKQILVKFPSSNVSGRIFTIPLYPGQSNPEITKVRIFLERFIPNNLGNSQYFDQELVTFVKTFQIVYADALAPLASVRPPNGSWDDATVALANTLLGYPDKVKVALGASAKTRLIRPAISLSGKVTIAATVKLASASLRSGNSIVARGKKGGGGSSSGFPGHFGGFGGGGGFNPTSLIPGLPNLDKYCPNPIGISPNQILEGLINKGIQKGIDCYNKNKNKPKPKPKPKPTPKPKPKPKK